MPSHEVEIGHLETVPTSQPPRASVLGLAGRSLQDGRSGKAPNARHGFMVRGRDLGVGGWRGSSSASELGWLGWNLKRQPLCFGWFGSLIIT